MAFIISTNTRQQHRGANVIHRGIVKFWENIFSASKVHGSSLILGFVLPARINHSRKSFHVLCLHQNTFYAHTAVF